MFKFVHHLFYNELSFHRDLIVYYEKIQDF